MYWYVIDAVDHAIERTRQCLFEPFDIKKWLKLAIIVFFIGGSGSFNSGGNGGSYDSSYDGSNPDLSWVPPGFLDILNNFAGHLMSYSTWALIAGFFVVLFLFIIIMGLVGSVMEFVFVESLVRNDIRIRKYFSRYMGKGLSLFVLRVLLLLLFMIPVVIVSLLIFSMIVTTEKVMLGSMMFLGIFLSIISILAIVLLFVVAGSIIGSFTSMSVPVSMYTGSGIFSALFSVFRQFRSNWQQMIIYWIGRTVLAIAAGIIVIILGLLGLVISGIVFLIIDAALYFILLAIMSDAMVWLLFIPILVVELILIMFVMAFIGMPVNVFMKYHMLSFLEKWYPLKMPMFDAPHKIADSNLDEWLDKAALPED
ncbi:DUF7544 domain-containing protein [Methanolobus psychrotolerans]|uniref:DUF7544 domain-containing protein n=1 Tax=Methanolobus psychrotolerans TaxID=1874706 RepID=UPI000B91B387|nr:hypothetical protein [Methanolobus psychrotolerans]